MKEGFAISFKFKLARGMHAQVSKRVGSCEVIRQGIYARAGYAHILSSALCVCGIWGREGMSFIWLGAAEVSCQHT